MGLCKLRAPDFAGGVGISGRVSLISHPLRLMFHILNIVLSSRGFSG